MNWLPLQTVAQLSVERLLNALPAGLLIAVFAWALLRVLRKQNSGTRFAVWFFALLAVAALPLLNGFGEGRALMAARASSGLDWGNPQPAITLPGQWAVFVFVIWAVGACAAIVRLGIGLWHLRQLRRSCSPLVVEDLDPIVRSTVAAISATKSFGSGKVTIATSDCVRVPAAIGFWKRTIVLPTWTLQELPSQDLNVILLHEFAHLRRWDDWTNLIQKAVRALFFFHPAVWWIESRLSVEREMACDDAVLAETANPHGYATCLVSLLEKSLAHRGWSMAQAAVHRAREASLRLAQILDKNRPVATRVWKPALGMAGVFSMVCLLALSQAPQFVAFDRGMRANDSVHAYTTAAVEPSPLGAAAVPAPLPTKLQSIGTSAKLNRARVPKRDVGERQNPQAPLVAAEVQPQPLPEQVIAIRANAEQQLVPQFQTLVFVQTTQYLTSGPLLWRVQVWRVMLVSAERERSARVPVANKI
ncbi:MAG: M56 family metallopeptidase [Acidobacteriia bacterium]|nr:M56 family metallopeptidase [Terriglobia bacterium]